MKRENLEALTELLRANNIVKKTGHRSERPVSYKDVSILAYVPEKKLTQMLTLDYSDCVTFGDVINKLGQHKLLKVEPRILSVQGHTVLQLRYNKFLHFSKKSGFCVSALPYESAIDIAHVGKDCIENVPDRINFVEDKIRAKYLYMCAVIAAANNITEFYNLLYNNRRLFVQFLNRVGRENDLFRSDIYDVGDINYLFVPFTIDASSFRIRVDGKIVTDKESGKVIAIVDTDIETLSVLTNTSERGCNGVYLNRTFTSLFSDSISPRDTALLFKAAMCLCGICVRKGDWYPLVSLEGLAIQTDSHFDFATLVE